LVRRGLEVEVCVASGMNSSVEDHGGEKKLVRAATRGGVEPRGRHGGRQRRQAGEGKGGGVVK